MPDEATLIFYLIQVPLHIAVLVIFSEINMSEELLLLVGEKIRQKRLQKKITMDQLAAEAGVTKGLVSQIENNRTVPSLSVLFSLIHALGENVKNFFEDLQENYSHEPATIIRAAGLTTFQKEPVKGFQYKRIITKSVMSQTTDIVMLELKPGAARKQFIRTEAFECKYVLKGSVEYQVENTRYNLSAGDTIFFNGRLKHRLKNTAPTVTQLLVTYFF